MSRIALLVALALTLGLAGTAAADTFVVAPPTTVAAPTDANAQSGEFTVQPAPTPLSVLYDLWTGAGATYGIPWQVLAAINKIESNFGHNLGPSSAGAVGWMQFLPSTWNRWGVDANGDGVADPANPADATYSAARYLAAAGGQTDLRRAIFAYNHADWYVNEVLGLAALYGQIGVDEVYSLDRLQTDVDASRKTISSINAALVAANAARVRLGRSERRLLRTAAQAPLVSDRLAARKRALQVALSRDGAQQRAERLRERLAAARGELAAARARARGASFATPAAQLLSAPSYSGGYVFPVGGGPDRVSVAHVHHDYPAADIAAPDGAPVYALANGIVVHAWSEPLGNCGIGVMITTADRQTWTYCHLSYLDPDVHAGATLAAGALIGLVGHTGDATGPHLHLQLDPADAYPQDEPWFTAFAGTAFRWQDEQPVRLLASAPSSRPLFFWAGQPEIQFTSSPPSGAIEFEQNAVYFTR